MILSFKSTTDATNLYQSQTKMILYNSIDELAKGICLLDELDYDYAYDLGDLRKGYYILKRRNGSEDEILNVLNGLQGKERLETDVLFIRNVGDNGKREGLMKIAFIEEGGNAAYIGILSPDYIILIYKCEDSIPWESLSDYLTLDHDRVNWDSEDDMIQDVFRYKGKIKVFPSLTIRPDNFNKDDF